MKVQPRAELIGVSESAIYQWADVTQDVYPSGKHFPAIARGCKNPAALDYLEVFAGRVAYVLPTGERDCDLHTAEAIREFGEFLTELAGSLAGDNINVIDLDEAERIRREGHEAIACIAALVERVCLSAKPRVVGPRMQKRTA